MSSQETPLMRELMIAATRLGARMFRQNTGMGWIGKATRITRAKHVQVYPGDVILSNARPFHAGFEGLSDLGGWFPVTVTPDMVGQTLQLAPPRSGSRPIRVKRLKEEDARAA